MNNPLLTYRPQPETFDTEWLDQWEKDGVTIRSLRITSQLINNEPVRVYCLIAFPETSAKCPAILHVHGGGGTVSEDDVVYQVKRGYACMSLDWTGPFGDRKESEITHFPKTFHASDEEIYDDPDTGNMKIACAVKAARCCLTFLASSEQVDAAKIGFFGISWGGFATWLINGTDTTPVCAVSIYGTGGLHRPGHFFNQFWLQATDEQRKNWMKIIEPMTYMTSQNAPILHINGTNDFFGGFDTAAEMLPMINNDWHCDFTANTNHFFDYHGDRLMDAWFDYYLRDGAPIPERPTISVERLKSGQLRIKTNPSAAAKTLWFSYQAPWSLTRCWNSLTNWQSDENGAYIDIADCPGDIWLYVREFHPERGFKLSSMPLCIQGEGSKPEPSNILFNPPECSDGWAGMGHHKSGVKNKRFELNGDGLEILAEDGVIASIVFRGCADPARRATDETKALLIELEGIDSLTLTIMHRELSMQKNVFKVEFDKITDKTLVISKEQLRDDNNNAIESLADVASITLNGKKQSGATARISKLMWQQ